MVSPSHRIPPCVATMAPRDTTAPMNNRPIHTEADARAVLGDVAAMMASDPAPSTPSAGRLCEARHFPIDAIGPVQD